MISRGLLLGIVLGCGLAARAQAPVYSLDSLAFLQGDWVAHAQGSAGTSSDGSYAFRLELDKHVLARHGITAGCKAAAGFDCEHGDLLYVYADAPQQPLKAIYFDNEGHVIHYNVTTPEPATAIFLSEPSSAPQFRLTYTLRQGVMLGRFEMQMPGQTEWHTYLEWSGGKR